MYSCKYCSLIFEDEASKYAHHYSHHLLQVEQEYAGVVVAYPSIAKYVPFSCYKLFHGNRHQFVSVLLYPKAHSDSNKYARRLSQFDALLSEFGDHLQKSEVDIALHTLTDFWSFYSELEVMHGVNYVSREIPTHASDQSSLPDLALNDYVFEVKTPTGSNLRKNLSIFVTLPENQKQLQKSNARVKVLVVDVSSANYQIPFEDTLARLVLEVGFSKVSWSCCVAYNSWNKASNIVFNPSLLLPDADRVLLNRLSVYLRGKVEVV